jgi:hypothetical protein
MGIVTIVADDNTAPRADEAEQDAPVSGEPPTKEQVDLVGDRPEADVLEQAAIVRTEQAARHPRVADDVPEADAWEQAIEAPLDEDERD